MMIFIIAAPRHTYIEEDTDMKKMTLKEFKDALVKAEMDFEYWGWEGILNMIAIEESYHEKEMTKMGLHAGARGCERRKQTIFDILKERGYYNN